MGDELVVAALVDPGMGIPVWPLCH